MLDDRLTSLESLSGESHTEVSLGVIKPRITGFFQEDKQNYEKFLDMKSQMTLTGKSVVRIDVPDKIFGYEFYCSKSCPKPHRIMCEDLEVEQLYRNCEEYRRQGKPGYSTEDDVFQKVRRKMLSMPEPYFVVGTHFRFGTYIIIGVVYPRKSEI